MKNIKDDKTDYYWIILNKSNSSYIFPTGSAKTLVGCRRLYFVFENC